MSGGTRLVTGTFARGDAFLPELARHSAVEMHLTNSLALQAAGILRGPDSR
jgi:hypothetical protein